jgi:hypothetical protein
MRARLKMRFFLWLALSSAVLTGCGPASYYGSSAGSAADLDEALANAKAWSKAAKSTGRNSDVRNRASMVLTELNNNRVVQVGEEDSYCSENPGVLAWVDCPGGETINVCPEGLLNGTELLSQVLIHEAVHLSGKCNECDATYYEIQIMSAAGQQPYENGYVAGCEFDADELEGVTFRSFLSKRRLTFIDGP